MNITDVLYLIVAIVVGLFVLRLLWRVVTGTIRLVLLLVVIGVVAVFVLNLLR